MEKMEVEGQFDDADNDNNNNNNNKIEDEVEEGFIK